MPPPPTYSPIGRMPQRALGRQRREAILDAASQILVEVGEEGLTLAAAAQRARTSVGSMYHFFADRQQLLRAVADRHRVALVNLTAPAREIRADIWRVMSPGEVVRTLFHDPLAYFVDHPDALVLHHLQDPQASVDFQILLLEVLTARNGPDRGPQIAATLYAVSTGTLFYLREMQSTCMADKDVDIEGVLIAFLQQAEATTVSVNDRRRSKASGERANGSRYTRRTA